MNNSCLTSDAENNNRICYKQLKKIKEVLDNTGFSSIWLAKDQLSSGFKTLFKQRCHDIFIQNWRNEMNSNSQCKVQKLFKEVPTVEKFMFDLDIVHRLRLSKYISRVHNLPVTYNRFNFQDNDPSTFCPLCNEKNMIGDESHYLFVCHSFANVRKRYLPNVLYDNMDVSLTWKKLGICFFK